MIVFDLICKEASHQFEGWFSGSEDYERQKSDGLLACPICGSIDVGKALMAPNVSAKGNQARGEYSSDADKPAPESTTMPSQTVESNAVQVPAEYKELLGNLAKAQSKILEKSEWVGNDLPEKAREMHYGDSEEKPIHGIAKPEDVADMQEEGIELAPLPFPVVPPENQN